MPEDPQHVTCKQCGKPVEHVTVDRLCDQCRADWLGMPMPSFSIYQPAFVVGGIGRIDNDIDQIARTVEGFTFDQFGRFRPHDAVETGRHNWPPFELLANDQSLGIGVAEWWLERVFYLDSPVYLERRWIPGTGWTEDIRGVEHAKAGSDIEHAWPMVRLLRMYETRGRPAMPMNSETNWIKIVEEAEAFKREHPRVFWPQVAARFGVSHDQLRKWRSRYKKLK